MSQPHPDDMTLDELEALPEVRRLFHVTRSFVAGDGSVWDVGRSNWKWAKAPNREPAPAARAEVDTKNAVRL